tara:strand:+ start:15830 stop:17236 length:1407 start_codon:yes stop_codon:yes gene_type:complete
MKINKETVIYLANISIKVFISFLSIRLLTTLLSKDEVGNYYLILSIVGFINLVILNPIGMYYNRTILEYKDVGKLYESAFLVFLSFLTVGLISSPFLYYVYDWLELYKYVGLWMFIIYMFLAIVVSTSLRNIISAINSLGKTILFTSVTIISAISGLIFSIIMIILFTKSSINWLYGLIISESIILLVIFFIYSRTKINFNKIQFSLNKLKPIISFMYPIAIITLIVWIQSMSYRIVIDRNFTSSDLAIAALGFSIPGMIFSSVENFGSIYFNNKILKSLLKSTKEVREKTWNDISSLMIFFYILTFIFIVSFSYQILFVVAGNNYLESQKFIFLGAIIEFMRVNINQLNKISHFEKKTKKNIIPFVTGGLITVIIFLFFEFSNIEKIYYVLIITQSIILILSYLYMNQLIRIKLKLSKSNLVLYSIPLFFGFLPILNSDKLMFNLIIIVVFGIYFLYLFNKFFNTKD